MDPFSAQGAIVAIENVKRRMYGLQYHPEVMHTDMGTETLRHFLFEIANLKATWKMEDVLEQLLAKVEAQVGPGEHVICALSGGVDSAVAATLVHKVWSLTCPLSPDLPAARRACWQAAGVIA